jgi:hypothetical protein
VSTPWATRPKRGEGGSRLLKPVGEISASEATLPGAWQGGAGGEFGAQRQGQHVRRERR